MATVFGSMATRLSDLDKQKPGTSIQKEGHTLTPPSSWNGPEDQEAFGSAPSQSPSQSLARKPNCHETQYCLEILVVSTENERATPPLSHTWQAPIVEDMVQHGQAGLTEATVTNSRLGHPVLWAAVFRRTEFGQGAGCTVHTVRCLQLGWQMSPTQCQASKPRWCQWLVTQPITEGHIEPRGPSCPHLIPPASTPLNFHYHFHYYQVFQ